MSVSLVKKSLELVSADDNRSSSRRKDKKKIKKFHNSEHAERKKRTVALVEQVKTEALLREKTDKVQSNIQKLLNLSRTETIHKKLENKLLTKVNKKKKEACPEKKNQGSAFTEEDFANFEKEYFVNGCY